MANKNGEIVNNYLKQWSKLPTLTLAKKIYNENIGAFPNLEAVRTAIRNRRGAGGSSRRKSTPDKTQFSEKAIEKLTLEDIDEGIDEREPDFMFARSIERMLVISDLHVPYHNAEGVKVALRYGKEKKIDALLINGDFMDFAPISHFTKDPYTKLNLSSDLDLGRKILKIIRNTFPNIPIYFKLGNHDDWLEKYLMNKAPELLDMYEFKLGTLLNFGELGIQEISSYAMMKFGKLNIVHGHELKSTLRSVNPARTLYLKTKRSTLVAHHHVTSEHTESDIDGDITTCWSMGCLSQLKPKYAGLDSKYNLGFAYLTKNQKGHFTVENKRIIKGELM